MINDKKIKELLILMGFIITIYSIIIVISSSYRLYKSSVEENSFNSKYEIIQIKLKEKKNMGDFIKELSNIGIEQVCTKAIPNNIDKGTYIAATNVIGTSKPILLEEFGEIVGKNLSELDFKNAEKVAVIGEGLTRNIIEDNGERYIKVFDEYFKVVGEIKGNKFLSYHIITPIQALPFYKQSYNRFIYLINNKDVEKINKLNNDYEIEVGKIPQIDIKKKIFENLPQTKEFLYNLAVSVINLILFSIFFAKELKRDLAIMRILGGKNKDIIKIILIKITKLGVMAIPIALIMGNLTINYINNIVINSFSKLNLQMITLSITITVLIIVIVVLITLFNTLSFKIMKEIR